MAIVANKKQRAGMVKACKFAKRHQHQDVQTGKWLAICRQLGWNRPAMDPQVIKPEVF